jgi:hypothetical protein
MNMNFDSANQPKKAAKKKSSPSLAYNLLTVVVILVTMGLCYAFATIFMNPYSALNPFPPPTFTATLPPPTSTPIQLPATWTPTPTIQPTASNTPRPTWTLEPSNTPFILPTVTSNVTATRTATLTKTPKPEGMPYSATISTYESTAFIPNSTCDTMYVAGQALDNSGTAVIGLQVRLGGSIPGKSFDLPSLTGLATVYGPSGFEFNLGVKPAASKDSLWIQLLDQSGTPLTAQTFLPTYTDCKKNLIFVRFQKK